ncbi:concanavalin A-like lectin/glucanase [Westerdykella ornata]|uniref:Concanavalin A-like lectin/glucanase n=1 Tax=Westerdykella ornata TaxID=318751 RepID=A0A6A6J854_WESOR|nr:concanavalin A-like lectin/glucanase [Westerdykella ornata]KAF2271389.1 concanavalin A-like lectin/glucanase [Westerdykella ornata]
MKLNSILGGLAFISSAYAAFDLNRGGAVLKAPAGESFTSVTGTFAVPNLTGNSRLSIWLGIGDSLEQKYVIGGGIVYNRTLGSFAAFFPEAAIDTTTQVPARASDSITVTVSLTSPNTGTVVIENKTQNKRVSQTVAAPATADPSQLKAQAADWWVQGYQVTEGELLTTPNYGTITFSGVSATTSSGKKVDATGAGAYELQGTSGQMFSKTTISANQIQVRWQRQ